MGYLFDTDTLSNLMRRTPSQILVRRLATTDPAEQFTSSITLGELVYGAHRLAERTQELLERINAVLGELLPALPFDSAAARLYGELRADLERIGRPIGNADLQIAAICLVHGHTVVTANVRHFEQVPGLGVENWLVEP